MALEILDEINEKNFEPDFDVVLSDNLTTRNINGFYNKKQNRIELSRYLFERQPGMFYEVLKHELIHWYVSQYSNHYRDGEETFEKVLRKHKAITNGNFPFADRIKAYEEKVDRYECSKCVDSVLFGIKGYEPEKFLCPWCDSEMERVGRGVVKTHIYKYNR